MPIAAPPRVTAVDMLARLRRLEAGFRGRWTLLILAGAAFCLIGPVLFGSGLWLKHSTETPHHGWWFWVGATALWFLPIMFVVEYMTRGKMFEEGAEALGDAARLPGGRGAAQGLVLVEMCLWGPRMVIGGTKKLYGLGQHRRADRKLASELLAVLANRGEGMPTAQLYPLANGNDDAFGDCLAFLLFHDLIGISKQGDRAWLLSEAKRSLRLDR
jgi:hypothetical protein